MQVAAEVSRLAPPALFALFRHGRIIAARPRPVVTPPENIPLDFMFSLGEHAGVITPTQLQAQVGISKGYASDLLNGNKKPSAAMAVRIFRATGLRMGPLTNLSDEDIAVAERMHG